MATLYITEFRQQAWLGTQGPQLGYLPPVAEQTVGVAGSSAQSNPFGTNTHLIRLQTDTACSVAVGDDPTATTSEMRVAANVPGEYFVVNPGQKLAVIANP